MNFRICICAGILLLSTVFVEFVTAYSSGAPSGACVTLAPLHGNPPANGLPPYNYAVSETNVGVGKPVTVTISKSGNGPIFRGFLLQARNTNGETAAVGKWIPVAGVSRGVHCNGVTNSSLTHVNNREKDEVMAEWIPPSPGSYEIYHTVVQDFETSWVAHKSQPITAT